MAPNDIARSFKILRKCQNKLDCLIFEMFFIKELKPSINKQCDSIRAKLFVKVSATLQDARIAVALVVFIKTPINHIF